jgi:AGZA family xanthine/uracil permease-like MFS transporter
MVMAFLDTTGTLVGLGSAAAILDENGDLPDLQKPMIVDAGACMFAALVGTSTSGAYIESAAGIKEGARTGLAAVVVGLLFAASAFFVPLVAPLQSLEFAYGPALVVVGILMLPAIKHIDFDDLTECVPAFLAIVLTVFSYNIANGLSAALAAYPLLKVFSGRVREVKPGAWVLGALCLAYYVVGLSH